MVATQPVAEDARDRPTAWGHVPALDGVRGAVLASSAVKRGEASSRDEAGEFALSAQAVLVTSGGIGANHELVRRNWPERLGTPPAPR